MADDQSQPIGSQRMPAVPPEGWTDVIREQFAVYEGEEGRQNGSKDIGIEYGANADRRLARIDIDG